VLTSHFRFIAHPQDPGTLGKRAATIPGIDASVAIRIDRLIPGEAFGARYPHFSIETAELAEFCPDLTVVSVT
jgi:hypothetical protein